MARLKKSTSDEKLRAIVNDRFPGCDTINFMTLAAMAGVAPSEGYRYLVGIGFRTATPEDWPVMRK